MFLFTKTFPTPKECTLGINKKKYIIIHHTGTGVDSIKGVLDGLYRRPDYASCHFVVDVNGDAYKIGSPDDVLWHAGISQWGSDKDLNTMSLGIEVVGPVGDYGFTAEQKVIVRRLIQHLMAVFGIPKENVLRHMDITSVVSKEKKLRTIESCRKIDIDNLFWNHDYASWEQFQNSLIPLEQ